MPSLPTRIVKNLGVIDPKEAAVSGFAETSRGA
jgi:hypothetical protein